MSTSLSLDASICAYMVDNTKTNSSNASDAEKQKQFTKALALMQEHLKESQIRQIRPSEGFTLIASGSLTKKDVFVLAQFQGDFFEQLQLTKALILGPPCIISCLGRNEVIPLGSSPVYTTAMRNLQVSATGISVAEKEELSKLVQWMGGHYFQNFGRSITHLISNTIKSSKYEHATLNGVPVMHVDWVQRVWERSAAESGISGIDSEFDRYRLPTFFGANITCSGLDSKRKDRIMQLVNENGGNYYRAFRSQYVDIVITEQSKTDSDKYRAAVRFKKDVLLPEWIFDSHEKGYALPTKNYEVKPVKQASTPTKRGSVPPSDQTHLAELSRISFVSQAGPRMMCNDATTVNETLSSISGDPSPSLAPSYQQTLAEICPKQAKKAGAFLDGCCIFLSGFRSEDREKLHRVLNTGGAMRYDEPNEGLTHIIVGTFESAAFLQWQREGLTQSAQVVRLEWLLQSIRAGRIVSELDYCLKHPLHQQQQEPDVASPASKKTLLSMQHSFKQPELPQVKKKLFAARIEEPDEQLLHQYSKGQEAGAALPDVSAVQPMASSTQLGNELARPQAAPLPHLHLTGVPDLSASIMSIDFDKLDFFQGSTVFVHNEQFNEEFYTQILNECESARAKIVHVAGQKPVDYAIVAFDYPFDSATLPIRARNIVTELYVEECMKANKLIPIEYYHRPIPHTVRSEPLKDSVIVVSIYSGLERDFIHSVAEHLGASVNKTFVKKERPLLVCKKAEGSKYLGALKWSYPIVTAEWLCQCAELGVKLPYRDFLVGDSPADFPTGISPKNISRTTPTTPKPAAVTATKAVETPKPAEEMENQAEVAADYTPLRNKRVSELATGHVTTRRRSSGSSSSPGLASVNAATPDSPHTPSPFSQAAAGGRVGYNFEFLEHVAARMDTEEQRQCVLAIIKDMRENPTPELERIKRQACTPVNRQLQQKAPVTGIPEFCTTPAFQKRMADDFERRWRLPAHKIKPDTPIAVIQKRMMKITCQTMGIPYIDADDDDDEDEAAAAAEVERKTATKKRETPAQAKQAAEIASPQRKLQGRTLFAQPSPRASLTGDELHYVPGTQSPGPSNEANQSLGRSTINFDKISFEESGQVLPPPRNLAKESPEIKQLTNYLKDEASRKQSLKRSRLGESTGMESELQFVQPFESEGFMACTEENVGWRDPADLNGAKRRSHGSPRMQHLGIPCFSISCADEAKKQDLVSKIIKLGGEISENMINYDPSSTHFLCERPNRGEKMLGSMAAGKWILYLNYIEESNARGNFVDEELYEWGNPKASNLPAISPEEQQIAGAACRWRQEINQAQDHGGAFSEHRVILSLQERSKEAIKTVLRAGGGTILEPSNPFSKDPLAATATHCFVDAKKAPLSPQNFSFLQDQDICIMSQMCIATYLMEGRNADLEKFLLKQ